MYKSLSSFHTTCVLQCHHHMQWVWEKTREHTTNRKKLKNSFPVDGAAHLGEKKELKNKKSFLSTCTYTPSNISR